MYNNNKYMHFVLNTCTTEDNVFTLSVIIWRYNGLLPVATDSKKLAFLEYSSDLFGIYRSEVM